LNFASVVEKMQKSQDALEKRLNDLEKKSSSLGGAAPAKPAPAKAAAKDDDDDVDLFGSSDVRKLNN
jgi:hypothetical protein